MQSHDRTQRRDALVTAFTISALVLIAIACAWQVRVLAVNLLTALSGDSDNDI